VTAEDALLAASDQPRTAGAQDLCCRACGQALAREQDLCTVGGSGPEHSFVNPAGVVHALVTVADAHHVRDHGERTTDFSWFPGWSWRYADCGGCGVFLGWCFEAVEPDISPGRFHGLRIVALALG